MSTTPQHSLDAPAPADASAGPDVLALLKNDHESIDALFRQYERLGNESVEADRSGLAARFCGQLKAHAEVEETLFYPALREAGVEAESLDRAAADHAQITQLITDISSLQPGDSAFDAKVRQLVTQVRRHVADEESAIFAAARASKIDLLALGARAAQLKAQVMPVQGPD